MALGYLTLITALIISVSAAVYSILGLTAIFAAAFWPIVVLGGSLEFGKIVTTLWLHKYWDRAEIQYKVYLCSAVAILMLLTSMGVFGFLSKAHLDQAVPSGDVAAKVAIYDEKIKTERDNIDAARKALQQMDSQVDARLSRGNSEQSAERAVQIRRSQTKERAKLQKEISDAQNKISKLNEERAPIASEMRKVEAEVGPIKYIAALVYGDNPEANTLEKAVRWVIILIVIVFDPLALTLLLAATKSLEWEKGINIFAPKKRDDPFADWTQEDWDALNKSMEEDKEPPLGGDIPVFEEKEEIPLEEEPVEEKPKRTFTGFGGWMFNKPAPAYEPDDGPLTEEQVKQISDMAKEELPQGNVIFKETLFPEEPAVTGPNPLDKVIAEVERLNSIDDEPQGSDLQRQIMLAWKDAHPGETFKKYRKLKQEGKISALPWEDNAHIGSFILNQRDVDNYKKQLQLEADNVPPVLSTVTSFGTTLPDNANKGDLFLRIDKSPTVLYKYNGSGWIVVDKASTNSYVYDDAYIDYLIERIGQGQYDPDLLSDAEREQIAIKLTNQG